MTWPFAQLGEVTRKIGSGSTPRGGNESYKVHGIPLIRSMNVYDGEFQEDGIAYLDEKQASSLKHVTLHPGDVLLNITGASVARVCRLPDAYSGGRVNQHVSIIRPDVTRLNPHFLEHLLRAPEAKSALLRTAGAGATREAITKTQIEEFKIPLPPLEEQRRIAAILDKADMLRRKRKYANDLLDSLKQSIFLKMFGDPVKNSRGLPSIRLGELGIWRSGGTPPRGERKYFVGSIPWFSSGELDSTYVSDSEEQISEEALRKTSACEVSPGSLMLGMYDTAALKSSIATVRCSCNQAVAFAKIDNTLAETLYVFHAIQVGRDQFRARQRGVRQKNLNLSLIREIAIPLPDIEKQKEFVQQLVVIERISKAHLVSKATSDHLFLSLQSRAFSGQL